MRQTTMLQLQRTYGNRAVRRFLQHTPAPTSTMPAVQRDTLDAGAVAGAPATSTTAPADGGQSPSSPPPLPGASASAQQVHNKVRSSPPDFNGAFVYINGLSMADILTTLQELQSPGDVALLLAHPEAMTGINVPRMQVALYAVRDRGTVPSSAFQGHYYEQLDTLPPDQRQSILTYLGPPDSTVAAMEATVGFRALNLDERARLIRYVGGTNTVLSTGARTAMAQLLARTGVDLANPATFRQFLTDQPGTPDLVPDQTARARAPYTTSGPTPAPLHAYVSGPADAQQYTITIEGHTVQVYLPSTPNPSAGNITAVDAVAQALAGLPAANRVRVIAVDIEPARNPADAYWAREYNRPGFTSDMTAGARGVVNIYPLADPRTQQSLDTTLTHETGHTLSQQLWGTDENDRRWQPWKDAIAHDGIRPSQYGRSSPGEDFSEALIVYNRVRGTPQEAETRALMPERFRILDGVMGSTGGRP